MWLRFSSTHTTRKNATSVTVVVPRIDSLHISNVSFAAYWKQQKKKSKLKSHMVVGVRLLQRMQNHAEPVRACDMPVWWYADADLSGRLMHTMQYGPYWSMSDPRCRYPTNEYFIFGAINYADGLNMAPAYISSLHFRHSSKIFLYCILHLVRILWTHPENEISWPCVASSLYYLYTNFVRIYFNFFSVVIQRSLLYEQITSANGMRANSSKF